jgi:nucleotide-binding universal stress UspA family protein
MKLYERVLVAVGPGEPGIDLIRYARALAALLDRASFTFVHVLGWSKEPVRHADALARLHRDIAAHFGSTEAPATVVHGVVVDRLLELAAESSADLILVGHARENSGRRALARRLAMQAPCSVWMKPFRAPAAFREVVAAVDYSESSADAMTAAAHLARRAGAVRCRALHVAETTSSGRDRAAFDRFTAPLDTASLDVEPVLVEGSAVAAAADEAAASDPIDLIVMGSRGRSRSESVLLGGEAEEVLMHSRTPVLVVKRAAAGWNPPRVLAAGDLSGLI